MDPHWTIDWLLHSTRVFKNRKRDRTVRLGLHSVFPTDRELLTRVCIRGKIYVIIDRIVRPCLVPKLLYFLVGYEIYIYIYFFFFVRETKNKYNFKYITVYIMKLTIMSGKQNMYNFNYYVTVYIMKLTRRLWGPHQSLHQPLAPISFAISERFLRGNFM